MFFLIFYRAVVLKVCLLICQLNLICPIAALLMECLVILLTLAQPQGQLLTLVNGACEVVHPEKVNQRKCLQENIVYYPALGPNKMDVIPCLQKYPNWQNELTARIPCLSLLGKSHIKKRQGGFPGGAVVENLPANAGDTGSSPGLGGSHMPRSN